MKFQNGRSMIEMLGVLAIIGVISIGGISLYRRAVDTNKANNIFDDVNRFEFVISERVFRTPRGFIDKADFKPISGFDMTAYNEPELSSHHISVAAVPKSVCRIVLDKGEKDYVMFANNLMFAGDSSICSQDLNEMRFYFGDTSDLCSFPAEGQNSCSDGCLCDGDNECKPDIYNPDSIPKMTEETVCCPKDNNIIACNGQCIDSNCGTGKSIDRKTCQCVCADPMKQMDENGNCVCKPDASGIELSEDENGNCQCPSNKPYYFDEASGGPACCAAGYTPVDGVCHRLYCEGTTCYLDDAMCGKGCSVTVDNQGIEWAGSNCSDGACRAGDCPTSSSLKLIEPFIPYISGKNSPVYGCVVGEDSQKICYYRGIGNSYIDCAPRKGALNVAACMMMDPNLNMIEGLCDADYCTANFTSLDSGVKYSRVYGRTYGCLFPNHNNIYCTPSYSDNQISKWTCYRDCVHGRDKGALCKGCSTPSDCLNSCTTCGTGETSLTLGGKEYCCNTDKTLCHIGGYYYFVNGSTVTPCGSYCDLSTGYCTSSGSCTRDSSGHPDCRFSIGNQVETCPNSYECVYSQNQYNGYGCKNKTRDEVYIYYDKEIQCKTAVGSSGVLGGSRCYGFGSGCRYALVPECAVPGYCPVTAAGYDMGTDSANPTCLCKYGDGTAASVTESGGHYYCCPTGHTYVNGACSAN